MTQFWCEERVSDPYLQQLGEAFPDWEVLTLAKLHNMLGQCLDVKVSSRVLDTGKGLLEGQIKWQALHLLIRASEWDSIQPRDRASVPLGGN